MANLCAGTPKIAVRDNRGLDVRTLRYNRDVVGKVATQYVDARTQNVLGQLTSSQDPRFFDSPTLNFRYTPALSGQVLQTVSADAGTSKACADIASQTIWRYSQGRDANLASDKSITVLLSYDALGRPVQRACHTADLSGGESTGNPTDIWSYGDYSGPAGATYAPTDTTDPRNANQRGKLFQHFDTAGLMDISVLGYAVQSAPLRQDRRFLGTPCDSLPHWKSGPLKELYGLNKGWLESDTDPANLYSTRWTYGALGQVLTQIDAKGHQQHTAYDCAGRKYTASVTPNASTLTPVCGGITYTAAGAIDTRSDANDIQVAHAYEPQTTQRLISITASRSATKLQALTYAYDGVGNVIALSDNSASAQVSFFRARAVTPDRSYTYDALYQLTSATGRENYVNSTPEGTDWPGGQFNPTATPEYQAYTRSYTYDLGGNLTTIGSSNWNNAAPPTRNLIVGNDSNRAVSTTNSPGAIQANVDTYFDSAGKSIYLDANRNRPLYWTAFHQLYCVVTTYRSPAPGTGPGGVTAGTADWAQSDREQYAYDGAGRRVRKYVSSLASDGAWNTIDSRYLPGLELRRNAATTENLEVIVLDDGARIVNWAGGTGKPNDIPNLQLRYQYSDRQNSCQIETDKDGNVITREEYYPYGGTAVLASRSSSEVNYKYLRYCGKERDASGLYYYGLRYYQPWIGRWLNPDPAGTIDGENLYCMVANNPVTRRDMHGLAQDRPQEDTSPQHGSQGREPRPRPPGTSSPLGSPPLPKPIPKNIHYVWEGKDISADNLSNVFWTALQNPDHATTIWTHRPMAIASTIESMTHDDTSPALHRFLAHWGAGAVDVRNAEEIFNKLQEVRPSTGENSKGEPLPGLGTKVASMFYRETHGTYRNYAAASDIARAALLVAHGGIYLDVDVVPRASFGDLRSPREFMIFKEGSRVHNAALASRTDSESAGKLLSVIPEQSEEIDRHAHFFDVPAEYARNNWGPASWWTKRAVVGVGRSVFGRFGGTIKATGPGLLFVIGANRSDSPEDLFPAGLLGHRNGGNQPPASLAEARRRLGDLGARHLDKGSVFWRGWQDFIDDSGAWGGNLGTRRSSM